MDSLLLSVRVETIASRCALKSTKECDFSGYC